MILHLTNYGRLRIHTSLRQIKVINCKIERGDYQNGTQMSGTNKDYFSGNLIEVEFDLSILEEGWYEWEQCIEYKRKTGYIYIEKGEITDECDLASELIDILNPLEELIDLEKLEELPELEGTDRQIEWAIDIRKNAIRKGLRIDEASEIISAKTWINNRKKYI